jgi:hypothetical protein
VIHCDLPLGYQLECEAPYLAPTWLKLR